jgi:hypothetical protein
MGQRFEPHLEARFRDTGDRIVDERLGAGETTAPVVQVDRLPQRLPHFPLDREQVPQGGGMRRCGEAGEEVFDPGRLAAAEATLKFQAEFVQPIRLVAPTPRRRRRRGGR